MTKIKLTGLLIIVLSLFLAAPRVIDAQFPIVVECQPPLTTFSDGSSTFDISFPPGGGTTCDTIADCPTVSLPAAATVYSVKVDMELSDPASEIGTPFIWIPNSDSDTLAQMRTSDGTIVRLFAAGDVALCGGTANFSNPSRITVMPGGDVWLANRDNDTVTRLSPKEGTVVGGICGDGICNVGENNGNCPQECEEYEVNCNYGVGGGPRGITYDANGKIWVGDYSDNNMYKFNLDGTLAAGPFNIGVRSYGMIGDAYGYVWVSDRVNNEVTWIDINTDSLEGSLGGLSDLYGIGMDNEGDIWVGNYNSGQQAVYQVGGANSGVIGADITPAAIPNFRACGVAVDQNNVVWIAECGIQVGRVRAFDQAGVQLYNVATGSCTRGVAVDFDGNIWAVNRGWSAGACGGAGSVTKISSTGIVIDTYSTGGNNPYNYSDMTGLRTIPQSLKIGAGATGVPLSSTNTFEVCTDGTGTCTNSLPCAVITAMLAGCIPNAMGNCDLPLEIFSITAGDYTLSNLEVIYGKEVPMTIGGLVPCGRNWDDPRTPLWNEKAPCNFCFLLMMINNIMNFLLMLAAGIAVLALIITGLLFVTSSGDSEKKNHAKTALKYSIWGFIVIFISWIIIDFVLIGWGYLDPLGGKWSIVDCDVSQTFCGDNIRQAPNDYGFYEECDGTDNPCAGACSAACTCVSVSPVPPVPPPATFCGDGVVQTPNDAGTGGLLDDGNEECDTDGTSCSYGSLVCNPDCTCEAICGVWFSGAIVGYPAFPAMGFRIPFVQYVSGSGPIGDWVTAGTYNNNFLAFPNADTTTLDGFAVNKGTRLEMWSGANQTGTKIIDVTGPLVVNNFLYNINFVGGYSIANCFGLGSATPSWNGCTTSDLNGDGVFAGFGSGENMHNWSTGSSRIICTAATFCGDGTVQKPNDTGTGGLANDGNEECDTDGTSCGSLVCEADCTCKTDPTPGVCGVWFTGLAAGDPANANFVPPFELMWTGAFPATQVSNWVANGNYPDNSVTFFEADTQTFDGIAIDENTRLELWDANNYINTDGTLTPILDITGPAIINNIIWSTPPLILYVFPYTQANCFGLDTTVWTNCMLSSENMHPWGNGSCIITCTAP